MMPVGPIFNQFHRYVRDLNLDLKANEDLYKELKNRNINEETIKSVKEIIDLCQFELYSGDFVNKNDDYHTKAINILKEMENIK